MKMHYSSSKVWIDSSRLDEVRPFLSLKDRSTMLVSIELIGTNSVAFTIVHPSSHILFSITEK